MSQEGRATGAERVPSDGKRVARSGGRIDDTLSLVNKMLQAGNPRSEELVGPVVVIERRSGALERHVGIFRGGRSEAAGTQKGTEYVAGRVARKQAG